MCFSLEEAYQDLIRFAYTAFDRIVIRGFVPVMQRPGGFVTWARNLLPEEPIEVYAAGSCLVDPAIEAAGDIDTAVVVLRTAGGVLCTIDNSRRAVYGYDQRIEAFGEKGMIAAENPTPTTLQRATEAAVMTDKPPYFFLERYSEAYQAELDHFVDVMEGKVEPAITGDDGRKALALADAATRSLAESKPVKLEP